MKRLIFLVSLTLIFINSLCSQSYRYDYIIFENSLMDGNYFYSQANYKNSSWIKNINNKLPVYSQESFTPPNSIELNYKSGINGEWKAVFNCPRVREKEMFKKPDKLIFRIFIKSNSLLDELPKVAIAKDVKEPSDFISIKDYITNYQTKKWLTISIPICEFKDYTWQLITDLNSVIFEQANNDGKEHQIFIDQIEFLEENAPAIDLNVAPTLEMVKGYEKHVDISWKRDNTIGVKYIKIYRSMDNGDFHPVGIQSPIFSRFADYVEETGHTYAYKICYVDYNYNETALSNELSDNTYTLSDDQLLDMVQEACFRYYWDGAEQNSGMALDFIPGKCEMIATGASGFGIMAILVATERGFITRQQAIERFLKVTAFLEKADKYHGAFSHYYDCTTGKTMNYHTKCDDGGDLVETANLTQGLLAARQYFTNDNPDEKLICSRIDKMWQNVEWDWYKRDANSNYLYWHWSKVCEWQLNHKIIGFNEAMITYLLAIFSPSHSISTDMYYSGWASQDSIATKNRKEWGKTSEGSEYLNGNTYYGIKLDVSVSNGGPLFFTHFSYLGFDPRSFKDPYTQYFDNNRNISLINYRYCIENPGKYIGYGENCWGITLSDYAGDFNARGPNVHSDNGTIAPSGALASFAYTPEESMKALKNYYRNYGKFLWGEYGFRDAFNLTNNWCANNYMGFHQAPITIMIENYRSQLIWNLFMSHPDVNKGLLKFKTK